MGLEHLLDEGHWSQKLKVKTHLWQWKYVLILRRFNSYLGLCESSVFCLTIVCRVFMKGNQEGEEDYNAQIFRGGTKGGIVETEQLFQIQNMINCISIMMLSRSKWVAEKECNFNYAINSLSAGTDSYQRADRISFLTLMEYKHSSFNLQLSFLLWCSRGWKTPSPFFWYEVYLPGSIHLFVLCIPCFFTTWISCDDLMMFTAFHAMA